MNWQVLVNSKVAYLTKNAVPPDAGQMILVLCSFMPEMTTLEAAMTVFFSSTTSSMFMRKTLPSVTSFRAASTSGSEDKGRAESFSRSLATKYIRR